MSGRTLCVALVAVICFGSAATHASELNFERIGSPAGPPPGVVTDVYQDRVGFIWIGSRDGLILHDGHDFRVFEHDASDPTSISGNTIRRIYEDDRGNLWVATNTGGLNRLDRATWIFERFRHDPADDSTLSHDSVYAMLEDQRGVFWVGTQEGLNRFDRDAGTFERVLADASQPGSLHGNYVHALYEDSKNRLWVGTLDGGLALWDAETETFEVFRHDPDDDSTLSTDEVTSILEDATGDLWIGTLLGLHHMGADGTFERFLYDPENPAGLNNPAITSLAQWAPETLWVSTWGGGLNRVDLKTRTFHFETHDANRPGSLGGNEVVTIRTDRHGALWAATWGGGVNRLSPSSLFLGSARSAIPPPPGVTNRDVTMLMHDRQGGLWIALRAGDLFRRAPGESTYRRYLAGGDDGLRRILLSLCEDLDGNIWVGTNWNLVRIDPRTGKVTEGERNTETSPGPGYLKALLTDRAGRLWLGTGEGGLQQIAPDGTVIARYTRDVDDPHSLSDEYVTALVEDRHGTLWVGTRSGGLNAFDPETGRAVRYSPDAADPTAIAHQYVTSLLEDSEGRLWVTTGGGGVHVATPDGTGERLRFRRYSEQDGLIDNNVMAILEDDDGSLWLSTNSGLSRFDLEATTFANYYLSDGLPSVDFEPGSASRDGEMLHFGSVNWIAPVPAGTPFPDPQPSPAVITSARTAHGEIHGDRPIWQLEQMEIPYGEWLSLEMAILEDRTQNNHAYAYRLGDEKNEWINLGARRAVTFTELSPGHYEFWIRGRNSQGVWNESKAALQIRVVPPFWMTWWFRGLVVLAIASAAGAAHLIRISLLEKRNRELVRLHEQREEARVALSGAFDRLRSLTRKLEKAKEDERRTIARELHDEMGPSLTAVIINMQLLSGNPDAETTERRIRDTIDLVDRMIERIRDLSLDLRPPLLEELGLVPALTSYVRVQAERAGLKVDVTGEGDVAALPPETQITAFRVVQEAVTNVIRHADATRATVTVRQQDGQLELTIKDDGSGFDVRGIMEDAPTDKALGLLGTRERLLMLGGELEITSDSKRGTEVRASIPVEQIA